MASSQPRGPLNYTTTIDPIKSATECITRLMYHGAFGVAITSAGGQPTGLSFQITTEFGPRQYSVPANVAGTQKALTEAWRKGRIAQRYTDPAQASRVAWRVIKDWLEAQLALIEAGVADMSQVMLPYMLVEASKVHGVTTERAQSEGQNPAEAISEIAGEVAMIIHRGVPLVIYNAPYDLTVLDREMRRHMPASCVGIGEAFDWDQVFVVDPLVLDKHLDKYRKGSRKLTDTAAHYGVALTDAHTSDADALAAMRVAYKIAVHHSLITRLPVPELVLLQRRAKAEQAASLYRYLRSKGSTEVVDDSWPIRPFSGRLQ
jgi:DNA polymerase III subunit epsilon